MTTAGRAATGGRQASLMPKNDPPPMLPTRGMPGGWHDPWDSPDDVPAIRDQIETAHQRIMTAAKREGRRWRKEMAAQGRLPPRGPRSA